MTGYTIGTSMLAAGRRGLDVIGQNIANASTPGYHRQSVNFTSRATVNGVFGMGVDVASITRYEMPPVRTAILRGNADQGWAGVRLQANKQIETSFGSSPGTIADGIEGLFNQIEQLTSRPDNTAVRRTVLGSGSNLASRFNSAGTDIDRLKYDLNTRASQTVSEINDFAKQIAVFNTRIALAEGSGNQASDLKDQRDQLIDKLSERIDVRTVEQPFGAVNVLSNGAAIVVGEYANTFAVGSVPNGNLVVTQAGSTQPVQFTTGSLAGQLDAHNKDIPAARSRLDGIARQLIARMNAVQSTGLGTSGPLTSLNATTSVVDPTQPLATQNLPIAMQAGNLVISVTDTATGLRNNVTVAIDPATQSLNDVAAAITAATGGQVQGTVNSSNMLQLQAQAGYKFDFAGRDTNPPGGGTIANPDTAGLLPSLGMGGFFMGTDASSIRVSPDLLRNPDLLAASRSGFSGDASNLERFAALRDQPVIAGLSFSGEFADMVTTVGSEISNLMDQQAAHAGVLGNLFAQEQSVTGVDVNEELVRLLEFQRMVEAASKYLSVVNTALDSVLDIIR